MQNREVVMGDVVAFSEICRKKRYRKAVTPEESKTVTDFKKAGFALKHQRRFEEYSACLLQVEAECARLIHERRCHAPFSEKPARRAVTILQEETDDLITFLKEAGEDMPILKSLGAASEIVGELYKTVNIFNMLRSSRETEYALTEIEYRLNTLRYALEPLFPAGALALPPPAYIL